jgi:predicted AlkP superfamily pyrophosphatase or phosphodiesterase
MKSKLLTGLAAMLLVAQMSAAARAAQTDLVLFVVVDQLRGDAPVRLAERFGPDGFRYLADNGVVYLDAKYRHAYTVTAVGHATLATGGNIPQHGMAANDWYDAELGRVVNCVEDTAAPLLGRPAAAVEGRSPRKLLSSTFGDELVQASGGQSRVFAVSLKDRGAILLGGYRGQAWWYDRVDGAFTSSRYYSERLPDWVRQWNARRLADRHRGQRWELQVDRGEYQAGERDDRPYERPAGNHGRSFPHPLGHPDPAVYYDSLRYTPFADRLTLEFVAALLAAEEPGQRGATDVLAVSFSATDYIGHAYGPFSLEAEDNLLQLDATLARLLRLVDERVGLERTLVVLTADHGVAAAPEYLAEQGYAAARFEMEPFMRRMDAALRAHFATEEQLLLGFWPPWLYFDSAVLQRLGLDAAVAERFLAAAAVGDPGIAAAFTRSDLLHERVPANPESDRVQAAFHPARAGHVYAVQAPFWFLDTEPHSDAATHGSPYAYDTHVPLMVAGPGIASRRVLRSVAPRDVAPTLSAWLGVAPPSGSVGDVLVEVLEGRKKKGP